MKTSYLQAKKRAESLGYNVFKKENDSSVSLIYAIHNDGFMLLMGKIYTSMMIDNAETEESNSEICWN